MFNCNHWSRRYAYAHTHSQFTNSKEIPAYFSRRGRREGMGVRRPLRYLSYHLDLDDDQRRKVAACLDRIKLEREQAILDRKKADSALADEFTRADVSVDDLRKALTPRAEVEAYMQVTLAKELVEIAAILDAEQRQEFAHLLRNGILKL